METTQSCLCGSQNNKHICCLQYLTQFNSAPTALALMRSRYVAYCMHNADYLFETTHISERKYTNKQDILAWAKENQWQKLEIVSSSENMVQFKAHYINVEGKNCIHHEKSSFAKFQDKWYYVDGEFLD
jgi:SEC-C motif domain protein